MMQKWGMPSHMPCTRPVLVLWLLHHVANATGVLLILMLAQDVTHPATQFRVSSSSPRRQQNATHFGTGAARRLRKFRPKGVGLAA